MNAEREWLGTVELADELGVSVRTVYAWRVKGCGPAGYRIGKHVKFRRGDIEEWLKTLADDGGAAVLDRF